MRSLEYTHERLWATVLVLAEAEGTVQERLVAAATSHLLCLSPDDLPLDMRDHFIQIEHRLTTKDPVGDRDSVHAITAAMDQFEARGTERVLLPLTSAVDWR